MKGKEIAVTGESLLSEVMGMKNEGNRFVSMSTVLTGDDTLDILYHFDKDLEMTHLRMPYELAKPVPSISGIFFAALLAENELQDLFGLKFDGLVLDFNRTLYLDEEITTVPLVNNVKVTEKP